jgi:hypothetical protein
MTPGFSAVVGTRYTHIFISAMGLSGGDKKVQKGAATRRPDRHHLPLRRNSRNYLA